MGWRRIGKGWGDNESRRKDGVYSKGKERHVGEERRELKVCRKMSLEMLRNERLNYVFYDPGSKELGDGTSIQTFRIRTSQKYFYISKNTSQ